MEQASEIAHRIGRTVTGPMWHGSSLNELLSGVTHEQAAARPIVGAHTIWELVLHIIVWADIARERLHNRSLDPAPPEVDWPPAPEPTAEAWTDTLTRLAASHHSLARVTATLTPEQLDALVPVAGPRYTAATLLNGVVEHGTYHGGQIALLKRALGA